VFPSDLTSRIDTIHPVRKLHGGRDISTAFLNANKSNELMILWHLLKRLSEIDGEVPQDIMPSGKPDFILAANGTQIGVEWAKGPKLAEEPLCLKIQQLLRSKVFRIPISFKFLRKRIALKAEK